MSTQQGLQVGEIYRPGPAQGFDVLIDRRLPHIVRQIRPQGPRQALDQGFPTTVFDPLHGVEQHEEREHEGDEVGETDQPSRPFRTSQGARRAGSHDQSPATSSNSGDAVSGRT